MNLPHLNGFGDHYLGKDTFKLGFGLMRLPKNPDESIDIDQTSAMVDLFLEAGGTYFDTAYIYDNGASEAATKKALVDRYPRESYTLCTKMNASLNKPNEEQTKKQFEESLARTGAGYFDYYLLHAIENKNHTIYEDYGIWDYVRHLKEQGLVKHYGFSFHGSPDLLEDLLTTHPDVDFIQLQINYADLDNPDVCSRKCYEIAAKHAKPITVMEPVKGGELADPIDSIKDLFKAADPNASYASWAIRYAASLDGIITVLSGMSNIEQMKDNLSYMKDFKPLTEEEFLLIEKVRAELDKVKTIPCTACRYCVKGCPAEIPIPQIFKAKNKILKFNSPSGAKYSYNEAVSGKGKASDCVGCGQCEDACPQQLPVIDLLKDCAETFE